MITIKKEKDKKTGLVLFVIMIIAAPTIIAIIACYNSYKQKEYKNNLRFLDPSWACTVTYNQDTVVLSDENQRNLIHILCRDSRKMKVKESKVVDTIHFSFYKNKEHRTLDVSLTEDNLLKIDLCSEKEFHIYIREKSHFEKLQQLVSPEGLNSPNKKINMKK